MTVEIRVATTDDKPRLLEMAAKATEEVSPFPGDPSVIEATADKALSDPDFWFCLQRHTPMTV